jgi:hypothetical protein
MSECDEILRSVQNNIANLNLRQGVFYYDEYQEHTEL